MSYHRVIPRDLFNEANLLKCYGKLYINLEKLNGHCAELIEPNGRVPFDIQQDDSDGSIALINVHFIVRLKEIRLFRPLNSRAAWPLWATIEGEDIEVFNENGMFSSEMLAFLVGS